MAHESRTRSSATLLKLAAGTMVLGLGLAGCSAPAAETDGGGDAAAAAEPMSITLGHAQAAEGPVQEASLALAERVSELTDGNMTIEVFPAAQLGTWEEMQEGLEVGSVDVVVESVGSLERYTPLAAIEGLPFLYNDEEQFLSVWDSELGDEILDAIAEDSGFRLVGEMYRGPRVLNTTRPIESVDDLAGLKLRVPTQQTYIDTWQALGASPTPMAFNEVFSALEQGALDGQENPIDIVRFNSMYEIAPYITETNHLYGNYHFQMWDDTFQSWPEEYRDAFMQAVDEISGDYREQSIANAAEHKEFIEGEGGEFIEVDLDEWRDKVSDIIEKADPTVQEWATRIADEDY